MNAIKATWTNGQILPAEPIVWPEGTALVVEPASLGAEQIGLEESQWSDDSSAIAAWEVWMKTLEPRILSDEERAVFAKYDEEHRQFNLEAVRKSMVSGEER